MDNNVQNIRSGRALAGFGKFFSGLGLVIAAIGAKLGGAVPVIIVGVVLLIIGGLMSSASGKKLQGAAQGGLAQAAMEQVLEEAEYRPGSCIDGGKFAESGLGLPSADNVGGSGLVCGKYHGRPLEISNLELSNTQAYQNPETEVWEDRELPIFKGQWMAADLGRALPCDVQAAPKAIQNQNPASCGQIRFQQSPVDFFCGKGLAFRKKHPGLTQAPLKMFVKLHGTLPLK